MGAAAAALFAAASLAHADFADTPNFNIPGLIIVWGADASGGAPIVSDFVVDTRAPASPPGGVDLINDDVHTVVTGSLTATDDAIGGIPFRIRRSGPANGPVDSDGDGSLDADDVFDAFGLRQNSDVQLFRTDLFSSFYVASNTPFNIDVVAVNLGATTVEDLQRVRLRLDITPSGDDGISFGSAAQHPHSAGGRSGIFGGNNRRLSNTLSPHNIFRGNQRTAAAEGSIADQSVRFDARYRLGRDNGFDLSDGVATIEAQVIYTVYTP